LTSIGFLAFALALGAGCQKQDDHPPFAAGCQMNCQPISGISIGSSPGTPTTTPPTDVDGGSGSLTGEVLMLTDESFVNTALYTKTATVSADGAGVATVTATWDGADPYMLADVASKPINWLSVKPDEVQGDALLTYQAVATDSVLTADLALVSSVTLDAVFTAVASLRSPAFGQVALFFRSAGTGAPLAGLHVTMTAAQVAAYASSTGWLLDDGTAVTDASGLVVFGNVETTAANGGTQTVTVIRAATATAAAVQGPTFPVKVVEGAATMANLNVQL
jgi:hypothetical protein